MYELRVAIQKAEEPYTLTYSIWEHFANQTEVQRGAEMNITSSTTKEVEALNEVDLLGSVAPAVRMIKDS